MRRTHLLAVCGLAAAATACGSDARRGQESFCRQLQQDRAVIDTPAGSTAAANAQLERFKALDALAPEAIRDEWHAVTQLMVQAASTDVASVDGRTALAQAALAASRPAETVRVYVRDTCGVELTGTVVVTTPVTTPVTTSATGSPTVSAGTSGETTTTVPATPTSAAGGNPPAPSRSTP